LLRRMSPEVAPLRHAARRRRTQAETFGIGIKAYESERISY